METEHLEKPFQLLNRFMYMVLGSSLTLLMISFGNFVIYRNSWHGFDSYVGGVWICVEFLAVLPGLYLLWNKPWKSLPFRARLNTAFGYLAAGWITLVALAFIIDSRNTPDELNFMILGSAILIALGYLWSLKRTSVPHDEIFP